MTSTTSVRSQDFDPRDLLRWLYVGRMMLAVAIWIAVLVVPPPDPAPRIATLMLLATVVWTGGSAWYTQVLGRGGQNFLYLHVVFDVALVTTIVQIMQGDPTFVPIYILVITEGALLLPLPGGMLIGALASIVYFTAQLWGENLTGAETLQILLFAIVALITGWLGDRVRRAGLELGAVESELKQLRLGTGDILGSISTGVLTVDGSGRLAYMNRAAEEVLGFDADEWEGAPVLGAVEDVSPGLASIIRRTIELRQPSSRFKSRARSGERDITLGVSTTVLEQEDFAPSVTAIFQDITELERLAVLDRRNERLEAVAELSASLAHEIKNPLASIRSSVEQMTSGRLDDEDRALLERLVLTESDRLSRLLTDFLEFSVMKVSSSEAVDMSRLVGDAIALVRQHPEADAGVELTVEGTDDAVLVPGDQDLLHRLVFNLVLNAFQFAGEDGRVGVVLETGPGLATPPGLDVVSPVRLSVRDSGPGIPDETVDRIFDPFFTTREGGSGLGLALVHRAVEAHGGALLVEDGEEGGAEFVIYLPGQIVPERAGVPS